MSYVLNILAIVLTYLIPSLALFGVFRKWTRRRKTPMIEVALYAAIAGPFVLSFLLTCLLRFLPERTVAFYVISLSAFFLVVLGVHASELAEARSWLASKISSMTPRWNNAAMICFLALFAAFMFAQTVVVPLSAHDSLVYAIVSDRVAADRSLEQYPNRDVDPVTGAFYDKTWVRHPPGLAGLNVWFRFLDPSRVCPLGHRTVSFVYAAYLMTLIAWLARRRSGSLAAGLVPLLFAVTPLFLYQTMGNAIDSPRMCLLFAGVMATRRLLIRLDASFIFITAMFAGLSIFVHLGSLLFIPVFVVIYAALAKWIRFRWLVFMILGVGFLVLQYHVWNALPERKLADTLSLKPFNLILDEYRLNAFGEEWARRVKNGDATTPEIIWRERLQFLSRPRLFGITYYLGLLAAILFFTLHKRKRLLDWVMVLFILAWSAPVLFKYFVNYRYIATTTPAVIYFAAIGISECRRRFIPTTFPRQLIPQTGAAILAIGYGILIISGIVTTPEAAAKRRTTSLSAAWGTVLKLAHWKIYSHPTATAARAICDTEERVLFTDDRLEPAHYFYLKGYKRFTYPPTLPAEVLHAMIRSPEDLRRIFSERNIRWILFDGSSNQAKNPYEIQLKSCLDNWPNVERIHHFREQTVYGIDLCKQN